MAHPDYPIPSKRNTALVLTVFTLQVTLLILASHVDGLLLIFIALAFSFLFLTNYSLIHDGGHKMLHKNPTMNRLLDALCGLNFPASGTMMSMTHDAHHFCNRTEHEMFDCYYPDDNLVIKYFQWYGVLLGPFWLSVVIATFVVSLFPNILNSSLVKKSRSASELFFNIDRNTIWMIRAEAIAIISYFYILYHFAGLKLWPTVLLFTLGGINWSTRQYVFHHLSERSVINGAFNLKMSKPMQACLLNYNFHQTHHNKPHIPWIYLPELAQNNFAPISYLKQYFRQFKPPYLLKEACPKQIDRYDEK